MPSINNDKKKKKIHEARKFYYVSLCLAQKTVSLEELKITPCIF